MELRKDYILDRWAIISETRETRPKEYKKKHDEDEGKVCFFCPGNENLTPPEISRKENNGGWQIRVFPNKFPAATEDGISDIRTDNTYFTYSNSYGKHEVLVETPSHEKQLSDLTQEEIKDVLDMYVQRINTLYEYPATKYVVVFKNHGGEAGTSLVHSHSQIISLNKIPPWIEEKVEASKRFDFCPYCSIISIEKDSFRRCFENNSMVAFAPYASRFNYEIWVFPKRHVSCITMLTGDELFDLADIMKKILVKLTEIGVSYNFYLQDAPVGEDLHFHIEVAPRIASWGGFELATGIIINSISPEFAASFYRNELE